MTRPGTLTTMQVQWDNVYASKDAKLHDNIANVSASDAVLIMSVSTWDNMQADDFALNSAQACYTKCAFILTCRGVLGCVSSWQTMES